MSTTPNHHNHNHNHNHDHDRAADNDDSATRYHVNHDDTFYGRRELDLDSCDNDNDCPRDHVNVWTDDDRTARDHAIIDACLEHFGINVTAPDVHYTIIIDTANTAGDRWRD